MRIHTIQKIHMFMTYEQHEKPFPRALLPEGAQTWRAVELTVRLPWLVATLHEQTENHHREFLLGGDEDMTGLRDATHLIVRLDIIQPSGPNRRWELNKVLRVWKKQDQGFTQWIYEGEDGRQTVCPPMSDGGTMTTSGAELILELPDC